MNDVSEPEERVARNSRPAETHPAGNLQGPRGPNLAPLVAPEQPLAAAAMLYNSAGLSFVNMYLSCNVT